MNNGLYSLPVLFLVLTSFSFGYSQDGQFIEVRDFETWTSAEFKFKLDKSWSMALQGQSRLDQNSSELKNVLTELSIQRKFSKRIAINTGFRYTNKKDNFGDVQGHEHFFRFHLDALYKHDLNRFTMKYRLRYTHNNEIGISKIEGDIPVRYLRMKASTSYNIKNWKLDPELSAEIFNQRTEYGLNNGFDLFRFSLGSSYKLKKIGEVGAYYRVQKEISDSYPKTQHIIRLKYTYTFKK